MATFAPQPAGMPASLKRLKRAFDAALQQLSAWAANQESYDALLWQVFRVHPGSATASLRQRLVRTSFSPRLQLLDGAVMGGALSGYISPANPGGERIVVNDAWLRTANGSQIQAVLLEELGHAIDQRLNPRRDTPGDEGEIFSALIRGLTPAVSAAKENDQRRISINGLIVQIEAAAPGNVDLSDIAAGVGGFVINGQCAGDGSGRSVASAGDVNGDGLADLIIGALYSDPAARNNAGRSYVVFGKTDANPINLSAIAAGIGGFVINGQCVGDLSGNRVSSAGDINGDGFSDLLIAADGFDPGWVFNAGRSYVVFGKSTTEAIELSAIGTALPGPGGGAGGFVINGQCAGDLSGSSVSCAGDVNGDGFADLIIGAVYSDPAAGGYAGRSYVVFGGSLANTAVDLSAIAAGIGGFVINGQAAGDNSGLDVASAGDVNGDGLADLIVGARLSDPPPVVKFPSIFYRTDAGRSYVVFGKPSTAAIDLSAIAAGCGGFVINGQCSGDQSGLNVACAGDVNGDGLADLIVGAKIGRAHV